ncbi:VWA domain-containing protein [Roseomonas sp. SSH11]|uniref:VWA domain-containing protein n=1 Tax=Pararoseomonas baculiformis TaxID=2820812 RepID=A0ABS4AAB8_9PROT|nr:VWA domain-containing protein [Pararoseomonas baculiformis]MBP0443938.1 VWA domain-containing protein [Pararoseomonas baculiformis]
MNALAPNLIAFGRVLRRAGLPVGPAEALGAAEALGHVPFSDREAFRAALRATMVHRRDHFEVFDAAFDLFWRNPDLPIRPPDPDEQPPDTFPAATRRASEAMLGASQPRSSAGEPERRQDAALTVSDNELLQSLDFEAMSAEQLSEAKREIRRLVLPLSERPTRRFRSDTTGPRIDLRATLRGSMRLGGEIASIARRRQITRPPPLVLLCDVSGSMARYAQILLHFMHAVANDRARVHSFVFGTRLTNITRALRNRDPEVAFQAVSHILPDWSGGTRIGEALDRFNRLWARRVLGQGAVVLLITDGLDRSGAEGLSEAAERLSHSCRRLIWLNPLLRFAGFQPRAAGIRALLPHVHEHRQVHNLNSLRALVATLSADGRSHRRSA